MTSKSSSTQWRSENVSSTLQPADADAASASRQKSGAERRRHPVARRRGLVAVVQVLPRDAAEVV
jgi:hypothetical protein